MQIRTAATLAAIAGAAIAATANGAILQDVNVDFSTDDNGAAIVNGQKIDTEYFEHFTLGSSSGDGLGSAAFDSTVGGPNDPSQDTDLLVGLGNVLIFQNDSHPSITGGVYDSPNDATGTGTWSFDFVTPVEMLDLALIDIDRSASVQVVLEDEEGDKRTYTVPNNWTFDVDNNPVGWDTLDLTTLAAQLGEGGGTATASEDAGFDATSVTNLSVTLRGSGAMDNLHFQKMIIPTPGTIALAAGAGLMSFRRKRHQA